jgi:hypothetical protein
MVDKRCGFAVITWGAAASHWLSIALNSHPQICCGHALNWEWAAASKTPVADGLDYMRLMQSCFREYPAYGDVHGISRHLVPKIRDALGEQFACGVLIREPIARLRSAISLVLRFVTKGCPYPSDTYENRLILHYINCLNSVEEERALAPLWRQEDLTTKPEKLRDFTAQITNGVVDPDLEWATRAVAIKRAAPHTSAEAPRQFADWEIEAIRHIVTPRSWDIYAEAGYATPDFIR